MNSINTEEVVGAYLNIRAEREKILREYEAKDAKLKEDLAKIEALLLDVCNSINADSIRTSHGTIMRKLNERFFCQDWENFRKFIIENASLELLEKRIHQGNFKQFMADHEADGLPPGVSVMREYGITVRKASN
jgi:hypothetical protein